MGGHEQSLRWHGPFWLFCSNGIVVVAVINCNAIMFNSSSLSDKVNFFINFFCIQNSLIQIFSIFCI